ncbi:MAG: sodium:solute symporter, partial [Phycisphaerae bacterium]|nr:sodium:solute symporter [Phycisphaerae bacterium]
MFSFVDWAVLAVYMVIVLWIGVHAGRRKEHGDDFFLAGRSMPSWAVAVSVLATALSAATFVGGPQQSYQGDLTYLASNIGGLIAVFIVGFLFLPA